MRQYQLHYHAMVKNNETLFTAFKEIHDMYMKEPDAWKKEFNEVGKDIVEIIREHERRLCATSEKGQFGKFSSNLSQKFWDEVRKVYPRIDFVGVL